MTRSRSIARTMLVLLFFAASGCTRDGSSPITASLASGTNARYTITQTISDEAQRNTIAFDGLAFLTGCVGGQSFLPPGKVADYSGFQYLRDNDPTDLGHNTSFVTIIAYNVLHILDTAQIGLLTRSAQTQVALINDYAYKRFPLMSAFRRQFDASIPAGSAGLDLSAVESYSADLYTVDGEISFNRAKLVGGVLSSFTPAQRIAMNALKGLGGVGNWNANLSDPLQALRLDPEVGVAVMTYASEMYAWYAGSVDADVYFCPERQGTYFGSFYLKDWPAMGNPSFSINEQLTANAGISFLAILSDSQRALVTGLVNEQRNALTQIVSTRNAIASQLRLFLSGGAADSAAVISLSRQYGQLDGEIVWYYTTRFAQVAQGLSSAQKARLTSLADSLGYAAPPGAFLYSQPIPMPVISSTDYLFK